MCFISILLRNFLHVAVPGLTVIAALLVVLFQISMVCTCILDATGWSTDLVYGAIGANTFQIRTSLYEIHIKRCLWLCVVFVSIECSAATAPMHHAHVNILVFTSVFSAGFFAPTYSTDPIEAS